MAVIDLREDPRTDMAIGQNIGRAIGSYAGYKISERRRQEAETALVKILQRRAGDPENYTEDQVLADIAGIPRYADMAAKEWMSNIQSQQEREYHQARLENTRASTERMKQGGGAGGDDYKNAQLYDKHSAAFFKAKEAHDDASLASDADSELLRFYQDEMNFRRIQMDMLRKNFPQVSAAPVEAAGPAPVTGEDFDKIDITKLPAATGRAQQTTPATTPSPASASPAGIVGPPVPEVYGVVLKSFRGAKDISSADKQARKELVAKGLAKDDEQAASMILDAVEKMPSLNKIMPTGTGTGQPPGEFAKPETPQTTPQQTKADAAIAEIVAPETQLAPATPQQLTGSIGDVFKKYEDKLDAESRDELQQIIATGDATRLNAALKRLRDKYGFIR